MAELHALANPRIALTFRDGLAWSLFWPYRRPDQIVFAVLCLSLLALSAWNRDFGLGFWSLGLSSGFFYGVALLGNPARLTLSGVPTEAVRRGLSEGGCTPVPALEPKTWRLPAPPWVRPSNPLFKVTLDPESGVVEGPFSLLLGTSRRLKAAGAD